ncbi:GAF and ANTAR domain-containing protein [Mycolicibacterium litorale]|uniref:GAF and ANTAR domain-containing protein n=1 Tax=Mycolicibacterium litorale TaxID=758802 RepID=UPI003CEB1D5A
MAVGEDRFGLALEEYVRRYARRARADMAGDLVGLTTFAVEHTTGADHAGVTLVTDDDVIRCLAASDGQPLVLDNIQRGYRQGPCLDAATHCQVLRVDDLASDTRWPHFSAKAVRTTPVRAILAFPVFHDGNTHAALNLYADRAGAFDADAEEMGAMIAARIAEALTMQERQTLRVPSPRTDVITEAKTLLMRRFSLDVAQAFALLVKLAKQENASIEAVARALVSPSA